MPETSTQLLRRRSPDPRVEPWIPGHTVTFTIDGADITSRATCSNPELAPCRLWCPTCEEMCACFQDWQDYGACHAIEWFDAAYEFLDLYAGAKHQVVSGPIEVRWDGIHDTWTWRYPAGEAAP